MAGWPKWVHIVMWGGADAFFRCHSIWLLLRRWPRSRGAPAAEPTLSCSATSTTPLHRTCSGHTRPGSSFTPVCAVSQLVRHVANLATATERLKTWGDQWACTLNPRSRVFEIVVEETLMKNINAVDKPKKKQPKSGWPRWPKVAEGGKNGNEGQR